MMFVVPSYSLLLLSLLSECLAGWLVELWWNLDSGPLSPLEAGDRGG